MPDPKTEELQLDEAAREAAERRLAREADAGREEEQHARRADKHAYLREKLEERARSEEDG